jgi:hypothetical protein
MKNIHKILSIFAFCALFFSCKKDFVQSKFELVLIEGDNQTGKPNEPLAKEIVLAVLRDGKPFFSAPIEVKTTSGSITFSSQVGQLPNVTATDANGRLRVAWTLGCLGEQEMTVKLYSPGCSVVELSSGSCQKLQEIKLKATAGTQSGWIKVCGLDNFAFFSAGSSRFYEFGNDAFLLNNNNLFVSSNDGLDWSIVNTAFGPGVGFTSGFAADAAGNWYMAMFSSGIFKSTNRGATWLNISNNSFFFNQPRNMKIDGNAIFVSDPGNGLFQGDVNGVNWNQVSVNGSSFGNYSDIIELIDGKWWMWDNDNSRFLKSIDRGLNWTNQTVASNLSAFPATFLTNSGDTRIFYLYGNAAKLIKYDAATNTGTTKSFAVSPSNASGVGYLNYFNSKIHLISYDFNNIGSVYSGDGTGTTFEKIDLGTTEIPNEFFITKTGRFLVGSNNGLFVKTN